MPTRIIKTERDFGDLLNAMKLRKLPLTVTYQNGKHRTEEQNRLQRAWCNEIAEQLGDRTAEDVRGLAKLTMGVPILRAENDEFREKYDRILRPLPYEAKLECMTEPLDFPVVFECCGQQDALDQAIRLLRPGGKLVITGIPEGSRISLCIDLMRRNELTVFNVRRQNQCVDRALDLIASGKVNVQPLITHRVALKDARMAFDTVAA